jgi:serine/threonine-protein kinase
MACVFRATDQRTGRQVAIKVPHPEAECDITFHERFLREAVICRQMDHPGVLKVLDEESHSRVYMVMEWVDGRLLREVLAEECPLPPERAARITVAICDALDHIHARGVVHRDLKPENVMLDAEDHVKLIDFGIAAKTGARRLTFGKLTNVMGTADYISPEQVKGGRGDARSDIYALGIILYEMLTGETPFHGENPFAVMNARLKTNPDPPSSVIRDLPPQLDQIVCRALERKPSDRYANARDLAYDLEHQDRIASTELATEDSRQKAIKLVRRQVLIYGALAMLPVAIFLLMLVVARAG